MKQAFVVVLVLAVLVSTILCGRAPCQSEHNYWSTTSAETLATAPAPPPTSQLEQGSPSGLEFGPTDVKLTSSSTFVSNKEKCRICQVSCFNQPELTKCQKKYFNYGCHAKHYCLSRSRSTMREFYSNLSYCIMFNGCQLNRDYTAAELNQKTKEGKAKQAMIDRLGKNETLKSLVSIQSQIDEAFDMALKGNLTPLNTAKITAFNALQVKSSFFITYLLVQKAKNERHLWADSLRLLQKEKSKKRKRPLLKTLIANAQNTRFSKLSSKTRAITSRFKTKHRKVGVYTDGVHGVARKNNAEKKYNILLKKSQIVRYQFPHYKAFLDLMRTKKVKRYQAARRIAYHYFYQHYLKLPKSLLVASDILNDIILNDGYMFYINYIVQLAFHTEKKLDIEIVYDGIQEYAATYVSLAGKPNNTIALNAALRKLEQVGKHCSGLLCEMFCKLYVINMAVQKCEYDRADSGHELFVDLTVRQGCKGMQDAAYFADADRVAPLNIKYCKASRTAADEADICVAQSLHRTGKQLISYCKNKKGIDMLFPVHAMRSTFEKKLSRCMMGKRTEYNRIPSLKDFCGFRKPCLTIANNVNSQKEHFSMSC